MDEALEKLKQTWQTLGREDPLWAIVSSAGKRGGKWDLAEFFATGQTALDQYHGLLKRHAQAPEKFRHVLDFGCGVGRMSLAWSQRSERVTGVDISSPMIERGQTLLTDVPNVQLRVNEAGDLGCFASDTFDLVFSHVCLQHIPWRFAAGYLAEFARVCAPGGWVLFNLPAQNLSATWGPLVRQRMVDALPFGLGRVYRRWRHGSEAVFDMHYTPAATVQSTLAKAGLNMIHREPDQSAGEGTEGFAYVCQKPRQMAPR